MDWEAWDAVIHGVAKSRTQLSDWTELNWRSLWLIKKDRDENGLAWHKTECAVMGWESQRGCAGGGAHTEWGWGWPCGGRRVCLQLTEVLGLRSLGWKITTNLLLKVYQTSLWQQIMDTKLVSIIWILRNKCLLYVGPNGILQSLSSLQQSSPRFSCLGPF